MLRLTTLVAAFATASCLAASATAEPPSSDPAICAHGGWHSSQSEHGHRFSNQGSCVAYVHSGRLVFRPTLDLIPRCFSSSLEIEITAAYFHQASLASVTLSGATFLFERDSVGNAPARSIRLGRATDAPRAMRK